MVEIPIHLKDCTKIKNISKDTIILQVLCNCGSLTFYLLVNLLDVEEENIIKAYEKRLSSWRNIENYIDPITKIRYLVTRNIFGKIYDKIPISQVHDIKRTHILKVKCSECGREKVIFDNRHHGYDAVVEENRLFSTDKEYQYGFMKKKSMEVEIKIRNDLTYDEYCIETEKNHSKEYSNAFSSIEIYGIIDGKKKKVFEEETA